MYMVTVDAMFTPIERCVKYTPFVGTTYTGLVKRFYGYDEVTVDEDHVICDVTEHLQRQYASSRIARYWRAYCEKKRERALMTIRPVLVHWAYRPNGPLGRRIIASLECSKKY
jgi:hypothetical protein